VTDEITDLVTRARAALTDTCAKSLALAAVDKKYARGDYANVIAHLDSKTRDQLAEILLRETK
jgi:hypothetical protein